MRSGWLRIPPVQSAVWLVVLAILPCPAAWAAEHPLAPPAPKAVEAVALPAAPTLDGRLEEWTAVPASAAAVINRREQLHPSYLEAWTGPEDASVTLKAAVHGEHLYLALAVTDDVIFHDTEQAWWHGDSFELFINADLPHQEEVPERFSPGCRQIFLMPANPVLPWGVVYQGRRQRFDDGGLTGIEVVRGPERAGGYDAEVRIPLANFGIDHQRATRLGFALAMNDADGPEATPESYLSWNQGFDLYLYPRHFGELSLPARPDVRAADRADEGAGLGWLWVILLGIAAVLFVTGPGARHLARLGTRRKLVALVAVLVITGVIVGEALLAETAAEVEVQVELKSLALSAGRVAEDAAPHIGAASPRATRTQAIEALLRGARVPARAGVIDAALVPLHPMAAYRVADVPRYAVDLRQARTFFLSRDVILEDDVHDGFELEVELRDAVRRGSDARDVAIGTITLRAPGAVEETHPLVLGDVGSAPDARRFLTVRPTRMAGWDRMVFTPDPDAPATTLRALRATRIGQPTPTPDPLLVTGVTQDGVPVLAHPRGPDQGRELAAGETVELPLPPLGSADRLWLLLSPQRAFPQLMGDHVLARVRVIYAGGTDDGGRELRNGEHLTAQRLLPGIVRPRGVLSREAWSWQDSTGFTHVQQAVPIPLDPARVASKIVLENVGPGGTLRIVAGTVARTGRTADDSTVRIVSDETGRDSLVLAPGQPAFADALGPLEPGEESVAVRAPLGDSGEVVFRAPRPEAASSAAARARLAGIIGLVLALMLTVLLIVDATGRLPYLTWRLAAAVLAAALIPLAITILLVDRENTRRTEAEHAARVRDETQRVATRVVDARARVGDAARRLARHLVAEIEPGQYGEIHRLARLYGTAALDSGMVGTVVISGADLPVLYVPLGRGSGRAGLDAPRVLQGIGERPGMHVSAWDGLLLVGTARRGRTDAWVRVTIGVRVDDAWLSSLLDESAARDDIAAVVLDQEGRGLAETADAGAALRRSSAQRIATLVPERRRAPIVLPDVGPDGHRFLAVTTRIGGDAPARGAWLALGERRASIDALLRQQREPLLWMALLGLVLVAAVATLIARRIAEPVQQLVDVTDAVRQGRFDAEVPEAGDDEVGRLTVAFDQMRRDLQHRLSDLDFLRGAQDSLAGSLDFSRRATRIVMLFAERFDATRALLLDARSARGPLAVIAAAGVDADRFPERPFTPAAGGVLEQALASERAAELDAAAATEGVATRLLHGAGAWLAVPLRAGGEIQGLVLLGFEDAEALPSAEAHRLLEPLAGIAASSLHNARLYRLAALDDVTRLPGATAFEAALRDDVERAVSGGPEAVLLRIGLDHLEHVTMRRDVELARELLRRCAGALLGVVGERVQLGRLREEELAVRLPGADAETVRSVAESIRARLATVEVPTEQGGEVVGTTVSIGIASCPADARSLEFLLDAAGRALAAAQREGGDHVEDAARLGSGAVEVPPFEDGAIFRNQRMVQVVESARRAARADSSVLITGETGTGKEVIASLIHRRSARANRPFVTVNCAAFPETLLESELFGHERGAFTGAERRREGRFELADGGTLFLDEVAEMTPSAQVKLLRVLQERQFTRLGGTRTIDVDVRIIAATNRDLEQAVKDGSFREDLYYRLNVIRLELPPLRERREEIPPLVDQFLREAVGRAGSGPTGLTSAAMDVLYRHPWPGNVRELKNVIERCAVLCEADQVGPEHLQLDGGAGEGGAFLAPRSAPRDDLNERQRRLLDHLARHGRCTNREYQEMTGTSPRTGLRDLQDLMRRGLVIREGKRRGAVYRLP